MSARQVEPQIAAVHPRETTALFGHREAEMALLNAFRSGRIPHAWLIGGAQGIGKATLAYRMARFVLAHRNPLASDVQRAEALGVDPSDPVARHVAVGAHGGLLPLQRTLNDKGVMRTVITVDETRETISFFGSTAAVEGWRVCIVDTVDELNPNAANALLKILEEPPRQSLFLLVTHPAAANPPSFWSAPLPRGSCRLYSHAAANWRCGRSLSMTSSVPRPRLQTSETMIPRCQRRPKLRGGGARAR